MKRKTKGGGDCYYIAGQFAMDNVFSPKKIDYKGTPYLVHAEVQGQGKVSNLRYGHAWIEDDENVYDFSNGRELIIPKVLYYAIGDIKTDNPKKYQKYTFSEARKRMLQYKHYGCWDLDVEYKEGGEVEFEDNRWEFENKESYKGGGLTMKKTNAKLAPNGKKSNLNEVQYHLVRTPAFKKWFGDWESAYETGNYDNVSKVIDEETKEPLVVYHGTENKFNKFDLVESRFGYFYFAINKNYAEKFGKVKSYFINARKIKDVTGIGLKKITIDKAYKLLGFKVQPSNTYSKDEFWQHLRFSDTINEILKRYKYDGVKYIEYFAEYDIKTEAFAILNPEQIKLADGTNTTFDANNPDIRYAEGGQIEKYKYKDYEIKQKLSFVEEKLNQKKLTPSQILYLASLLNFGHHDIEFSGFSGKKINNFYQKRNELRQRIEEIAKPIRKGYVGYLDEEEAYHFTNMGSLFHIIEDGRINTANNNLSITTNFLLGEKGTSTVRNYRGMGSNAEKFSDLPVKLVLDMNKLKKEAVFNTGKWSGGTHFGEYELIVSDFKKPFPYYIKRIEIDKNEMDESGILNYPLSIYKDYKYSSKSKPITISFKDQVKKLNIPIIERKRIDVKEYLFGENSKNIRYAQGGGLDNIEVKIIEDDSLAEKVYDIVQDDLSVAVPRLALIENGKVIGGIYLEPAHSYVLDGKRKVEALWEYKFDIYIKRSKRKKGYSKLLLDAMIKDFVDNFPDADQIRGEVINNRLEKSLIKNYGFNCDSGNQEEITYCYLSREDAIDYLKRGKFLNGGKLDNVLSIEEVETLLEIINTDFDEVLSIEQVENKLGRKINSWNDDIIYLSGIEYKKVYLRPEYKRVF